MTEQPVKKTGGNLKGAGPGRPKGVPNKLTASVKEAIEAAFHGVGGAEYLMRQAEENPQAFMTLLGKIIPAQVQAEFTGKNGGPVAVAALDASKLPTEVLAQIMAAKDARNSDAS